MRHLSHEYNVSLEIFTIKFSNDVLNCKSSACENTQAQVGDQSCVTKTGGILFHYTMCALVFFYDIEMI